MVKSFFGIIAFRFISSKLFTFLLTDRYAPETLSHNKYSFNSDVWSFGIVNFEMFSHGQEPNLVPGKELTPYELVERLMKGERYTFGSFQIQQMCS